MGSQDERKWWSDHPYLQAMKFGHLDGVPQPQVLGTYHGYDHHFLHPGMCFFREISPMPPTVDTVTPSRWWVSTAAVGCHRKTGPKPIWKRWNDGETTVAEATGCGRTALFGGDCCCWARPGGSEAVEKMVVSHMLKYELLLHGCLGF